MFVMSNHILAELYNKVIEKAALLFNLRAHLRLEYLFLSFIFFFLDHLKQDIVFFCCRFSILRVFYELRRQHRDKDIKGQFTTCIKTLVLLPVFPKNISAEIFPQSGSYFGPSLEKFSFTISRPPPQACKGIFLFPLAFGQFSANKLNIHKPSVCVCVYSMCVFVSVGIPQPQVIGGFFTVSTVQ